MNWTLADDKLPLPDNDVLVFFPWFPGHYEVRYYDAKRRSWYPGGSSVGGTYWMSLPPRPEQEQVAK